MGVTYAQQAPSGQEVTPVKSKFRLWREDLESVLRADRFDLDDWHQAKEGLPQLETASLRAAQEFVGQPLQDAFFSLYKRQPQLADPLDGGLEPLADLIQRGMETPNWQRLRETSIGDRFAAGVGGMAFVEDVLKALPPKAKKEAQKAREQAQAAQANQGHANNLEALAEMLQGQAGQAGAGEGADPAMAEALADQAAQALAQAANAKGQAQDQVAQAAQALAQFEAEVEANEAQLMAAMNQAAGKANEKAQDAQAAMRGFALAAGGDPQNIDTTMAQAAMKAMQGNPELKQLAEMLGWAKRAARAEWRKSPRGRQKLTGYKVKELAPQDMAPQEWHAMLSDDETQALDWQRRAVDGGVIHRDFEGDEKLGRGELVIVRDESGSMTGGPHALAVALEWALLETARRDNRDFYSVPFSGWGQKHVWAAPKPGQADPQGLLEHLGHFYGGGTDIYPALVMALDLINYKGLRADVLVITDDAFGPAPDEFMARLAEVRDSCPLRVEAVVIGASGRNAEQWADKVTRLDDFLRNRDSIKTALAGVV